jgi:hypothetical protein
MTSRIALAALTIAVAKQSMEAIAQSNTASYYLSNRNREIRRASNASYFINQNSTNSIFNQAARRYDFSSVNNNVFSNVRQKPFSNANTGSGLSPYLGLGGIEVGSVPNYYSVVRPQIEQQRINERAQREQMQQQQELTQMAARTPFGGAEGSTAMLPTGHVAVFMNFFGYYPQPAPPRR